MGEYLRYKSAIGNKLSELVILVVARHWTQQVEWYFHEPSAIKAGIKPEVVQAIAAGRRPSGMSKDEEIVYDFCSELHANKCISDPTYRPRPGSFWRARRYRYAGHQRLLYVRGYDNEWYSHGRAGREACPAATVSQVNFGVKMWFGNGQQLFSRQYLFMPMCGLCGKTWTRGRSQANT